MFPGRELSSLPDGALDVETPGSRSRVHVIAAVNA